MAKTYLDSLSNRSAALDGSTASDGLFSWAHKDGGNTAATVSSTGLVLAAGNNGSYGTSADTDTDSMYAKFTISGTFVNGALWVDVSQNGTYPGGTGTEVAFFGGNVQAFDINGGAFDPLGSAGFTFQAGDYEVRINSVTGALTVTHNGSTILTATAVAALGSGKRKSLLGYDASSSNWTVTNFGYGDVGGSPDVTVNLTGQAITASAGTILPARSLSLVGQAVATALGTLTPARSLPLTGTAITASQGTITASSGGNVTVSLTGGSVTASLGTLSPSKSIALSGQPATAAAGTLTPAKAFALTGQASTSAAGTITADPQSYVVVVGTPDPTSAYRITATPDISSGDWIQWRGVGGGAPPTGLSVLSDATWMFSSGNTPANFDVRISDDGGATWGSWATQSVGVTVALTGLAATASAGTAGNTHAITPTGQAVTASAGTLTRALSITLTGSAVTASAGSIVAAVAAALNGLGLSIAQGTISVSAGGNVTVGLTGLGATAAQGAMVPSIVATLSGVSSTSAQGSVALGKAFTIAGLQVAASQGSLALSAALQLVGSALTIAQGSISVTAGGNVTVNITGQQLAAALGTLSPAAAAALTGGTATTAAGVVSIQRALALLGLPATVTQGTITAQGGTGVTVNLTGLVMALTGGSLSPEMATVLQGTGIQVDAGTVYALTPAAGGSTNPFPSVEGQVASPNPVSIILNPQEGTTVAGEIGCIIGRFGRMDQNGEVWNGRRGDGETLGFVLAWPGGWGSVYWTDGRPVMRAGLPITIAAGGDFWARFGSGAVAGARVYASLVDGAAVSGYAAGCEPTPWYVVTQAAAGELAIISTTSRVN